MVSEPEHFFVEVSPEKFPKYYKGDIVNFKKDSDSLCRMLFVL